MNLLAMVLLAAVCIIVPLRTNTFGHLQRAVFASCVVLLIGHPVVMAGHYGLLTGKGRNGGDGASYCRLEEGVAGFLFVGIAAAAYFTMS